MAVPLLWLMGVVDPAAMLEIVLVLVALGLVLGFAFPEEGFALFLHAGARLLALGRHVVGLLANVLKLFD